MDTMEIKSSVPSPDSPDRIRSVVMWRELYRKYENTKWPADIPHIPRLNLPPLNTDISVRVGLECDLPTKDDKHRIAHLGMKILLQEAYDMHGTEPTDEQLIACATTAYDNLLEEFLRQLPEVDNT